MAQLVVTAGQAALNGVQALAPALASTAANAAVNALLAPHREGPRLSELPVQTSTDGAPMARIWGRGRIAGQVIWASHFSEHRSESGGGKGGPSRTDYSYSISFAVGLCEGEISGIGRIWANGALLDRSRYPVRVHTGAEDQAPDALIQTIEGVDAPAFRGTAYVVMEDWPLDAFGNRIPNLSFEVFRPVRNAGLERQVRAVNLIPGSGEFAYAVEPVMRELGPGHEAAENAHNGRGLTDIVAALDDLERDLPACRSVQLVVSWFGTSLDCGACEIRPGVETRDKVTRPLDWSVAGTGRAGAHLISQADGRPVYGGTPDDASVIAAIRHLKERGYAVTLYPFILMDVPGYPWRGRISGPDGSPDAAGAVAAFFGTAAAGDYSVSGDAVSYAGPGEWRFRRFILHCAALAKAAGGVDGFLIGSEMVGLTTLRDAAGTYPAVDALCDLAGAARSVLGSGVRLSYAADWTEYHGHQPGGGAKIFHLDPLWSDPAISAVAIDWYVPLSDWTGSGDEADAAIATGPHDPAYLAAGVTGGEGYDWYYASDTDRENQIRTPIADGAHGEDWIWRVKDLHGWWSNAHHDRPGGVRDAVPTGWVPRSKPLWLTEVGCPAVDLGANRPNVFLDPKSDESALPWHSTGTRDDLMSRRYLEALLSHWEAGANNPVSPVYGGPMVDPDLIHVWTWDARPWPGFPTRTDIWSDGPNWERGHWLNGRAGQVPVAGIVTELAEDAGMRAPDVSALDDLVSGYTVDRPMSMRAALEPLAGLLGFGVFERADGMHFVSAGRSGPVFALAEPVAGPDGDRHWTSLPPAELPRDVALGFFDDTAAYRPGRVSVREAFGTVTTLAKQVCVVADPSLARSWCSAVLADLAHQAPVTGFSLPPSALAVEAGDTVQIDTQALQVLSLDGGDVRQTRACAPSLRRAAVSGADSGVDAPGPALPSRPLVTVLDIPLVAGAETRAGPLLAAHAEPWPGRIVYNAGGAARAESRQPARIGVLTDDLPAGPLARWDRAHGAGIELYSGALASLPPDTVLSGGNRIAVAGADGEWEILAFADAELVSPQTWRVRTLLRGLDGSRCLDHAAGSEVVVLAGVSDVLPVAVHETGVPLSVAAVPDGLPVHHSQARTVNFVPQQRHMRPLAPVHLRARRTDDALELTWIRQTRIGGDSWAAGDVPLGEIFERYLITLSADGETALDLDAGAPVLSVPLADIDTAFGGRPDALTVNVAQVSDRYGPGETVSLSLDL